MTCHTFLWSRVMMTLIWQVYVPNPWWELVATNVTKNSHKYPCCEDSIRRCHRRVDITTCRDSRSYRSCRRHVVAHPGRLPHRAVVGRRAHRLRGPRLRGAGRSVGIAERHRAGRVDHEARAVLAGGDADHRHRLHCQRRPLSLGRDGAGER